MRFRAIWKPVSILSKLCSFYPFDSSLNYTKYFYLNLGVLSIVLIYGIASFVPGSATLDSELQLVYNFLLAKYITMVSVLIMTPVKLILFQKQFKNIFDQFSTTEKILDGIGMEQDYSRYSIKLLVYRVSTVLVMVCCNSILIPNDLPYASFSLHLFYSVSFVFLQLVQVQFYTLLSILRDQFANLANALHYLPKSGNCEGIEILVKAQNSLVATSELINDLYSQQLLLTITHTFLTLNSNLYDISIDLRDLIVQMKKIRFIKFGLQLAYFGHSLLDFKILAENCTQVNTKAKEFNRNLYLIMISSNHKSLTKNERLKMHLLLDKEVIFKACGLFPLDFVMYHSALATCFAYLVLMLQVS